MALTIISKAQAIEHLRIDLSSTADDAWLDFAIPGVSAAVVAWLGSEDAASMQVQDSAGEWIVVTDTAGDPIPHPVAVMATLVELAQQYRFRDGSEAAAVPPHWGHGFTLGMGATALLTPLRGSRIA